MTPSFPHAQPLPAEAHQLAATSALGTPVAAYYAHPPYAITALLVKRVIPLLVALLVPVGLLIIILALASQSNLVGVVLSVALGGGIAFLVARQAGKGLLLTLQTARQSGGVLVCTEGMLFLDHAQPAAVRWDEIETVWHTVTYGSAIHTLVRCRDGRKFAFTDALSLGGLRERIDGALVPRLLPEAMTTYRRGDGVLFGVLAISQLGIHKGTRLIPWSAIAHLHVAEAGILITGKSGLPLLLVATRAVPNAAVFEALANAIRTGQI
jgi:hypothetical protein